MSGGQIRLAEDVLRACEKAGVNEIILCAGARNAPLVSVLSSVKGVHTYSFFEERSAAFFALGRMQATRRPVAVVTTSGTAAAQLLPAAIEADYQGLPLVLITADRPLRYRGSGAPQTIVQPGLFSHYVEKTWDIESGWHDEFKWSGRRPVHINVCFDEPLLDAEVKGWTWKAAEFSPEPSRVGEKLFGLNPSENGLQIALKKMRRPLILVGPLSRDEAALVKPWLQAARRPVYAEGASQLRGCLPDFEIPEAAVSAVEFDGVIRIGGVPTLRFWRELENSQVPVVHFSNLPYSGLPRTRDVSPLSALAPADFEAWKKDSRVQTLETKLTGLLETHELSEPGWMNWISKQVRGAEARLFLGNSLPIREWDLAAESSCRANVFVNRGVNGIDGLISTFLGVADAGEANWAVLGDLSTLYDLTGPWALQQRPANNVNLVVINNGGGKIFQRIFHNPLFENRHSLRFKDWAKMWDWEYVKIEMPVSLATATRPRVIEIVPSEEQTEKFWLEWSRASLSAVKGSPE